MLSACSSRPTGGAIRVLNGKGGKVRTVGMDPAAFQYIANWLVVRTARGLPDTAPMAVIAVVRKRSWDAGH